MTSDPWFLAQYSTRSLFLVSVLVAILLLLVVILVTRNKLSKGNTIILVGPQDAGKTAIFSNLVCNRTHHTYTSLQSNSSIISLPADASKTVRIVDVPGHPRIRNQFSEYMRDARGIVFVVDASTVSRNGAAVAEHLHHILHAMASHPPSAVVPPLLVVAHKLDRLKKSSAASASPSSVAISRVRTVTARELSKRRAAQMSGVGVEGLGEEGEGKGELGGLECGGTKAEFDWDRWEGGDVKFVASWVKVEDGENGEGEDGLRDLKGWIATLFYR